MKKSIIRGITSGRMCTEDKGDAGCYLPLGTLEWHGRICLLELMESSQKNCLSGWQKRSAVLCFRCCSWDLTVYLMIVELYFMEWISIQRVH